MIAYFFFILDGRTICGRRARVEISNGKTGGGRYRGPPRSRGRPFHPDDRCYECGDRGHYARDCNRYRRGGRRRYALHFEQRNSFFKTRVYFIFLLFGYNWIFLNANF